MLSAFRSPETLATNFLVISGDYMHKYTTEKIKAMIPSCSVLLKRVGDNVVVGHSTWHEYRAMPFRYSLLIFAWSL